MAATIPHLCPYCGHDNIVFTVVHAVQIPITKPSDPAIFECLASCGACHRCAVITLSSRDQHSPDQHKGLFNLPVNSLTPLELLDFQPKPKIKTPPRHLPPDVEKAMIQVYALESQKADDRELFEPTVIMARKAVERAIKHTAPELSGMLGKRLNELRKRGDIPQALLDWTTEVKNLGNDGAHDADSTATDARQAVLFAETFLTYIFTMPEEIRLRREAK